MTPLETILGELNQKYGFIASVLVRRDGRFIARAGDPKEPIWNDPYNLFFRDAETINNTFEHLAQQTLPQILAQGQREVWLFKPREDVVLGTVKEDPRGAVEMYLLSKKLAAELPALFAGADFD
jgi:hypothetical protein